jgi:hypothetical protein
VNEGGDGVSRLDANSSWRDAGPEKAESDERTKKEKDCGMIVYTLETDKSIN